jgi:hypothetical protein
LVFCAHEGLVYGLDDFSSFTCYEVYCVGGEVFELRLAEAGFVLPEELQQYQLLMKRVFQVHSAEPDNTITENS